MKLDQRMITPNKRPNQGSALRIHPLFRTKGLGVLPRDHRCFVRFTLFASLSLTSALWNAAAAAQGPTPPCADTSGGRTTIELNLTRHAKTRADELKQALQSGPARPKVRIELTPLVNPPTNIGIGRCVEAEVARHAIRTAMDHGIGIDRLVFQEILPHRWIFIGTTQVAELSWTPITPAELERLLDSTLSTDAFQALYRSLATPKERKQPFGMEPVPFAPPRGSDAR